jgi:protein-tyrosine phosphatase
MVTRILFVCLGNICRSPAAEGVFAHLAKEAGLAGRFEIASAGTGSWHVGELADARMREAASRRQVTLTSLARQVSADDFHDFDYIFAMDSTNLRHLRKMAPRGHRAALHLFRDFDPESPGDDVPDPYYGGDAGFEEVLDIVTRTGRALLTHLTRDDGRG